MLESDSEGVAASSDVNDDGWTATSSSGLTEARPPEGGGDDGAADDGEDGGSNQPPSSGYDEAGPVYDGDGNRVDPSSGQPLDQTPNRDPENKDDAFKTYLEEHGYHVEVNEQGDYQIVGARGSSNRGESGMWHGQFGNPTDYTPQVQELWRAFENQWADQNAEKASAERGKRYQEDIAMMGDAPVFDEEATNESIEAARQARAIEMAMSMDAAMAGAARGRVGVGAQAGLQAQAGNQAAAQQAEQGASLKLQAQMLNFNAQLQHYQTRIKMLDNFIAREQSAVVPDQLHQQRIDMLMRSAAIERQILQMQLDQEERAQNFGLIGDIIQAGGSLAGGAAGGAFGGP